MSMLKLKTPVYNDGRTKQSFKDETDINKLLQRAEKTGTISHLNKHQAHYVDFSDFDFFENEVKLAAGATIFAELPAELRSEFNQSPAQFFKYVNDPDNKDRLGQLLPALAAPGRQLLRVDQNIKADEAKARVASEKPKEEPLEEGIPKPPLGGQSGDDVVVAKPPEGGSSAST